LTTRSVAINTDRIDGTGKELLIVALAVTVVSLAVTDSSFLMFAVCIGLAVAALLRFDFFVYGLVFLLPWYPRLDVRLPLHDLFLLFRFVLLAAVWMIRRRQGKPFADWICGNRLKKGALLFVGVATFSLLVSSIRSNIDAYRSLIRLYSYLALFFAMCGWLETRRQVITMIKLLLLSTIAVALFGFYQVLDGSYTGLYFHLYPTQEEFMPAWNGRIPSILFHFNALAGYLNLVLPFSIACMTFAKDQVLRILGFVSHAMAGAALYFTASRGGLIAYGGMLFISIWYLTPKRKALLKVFLSIVLAAGLVLSMQERGGIARLQDVDDLTQASRLALWGAAGAMFVSHPVLGVGYGNYRLLYNDYLGSNGPDALDSHNLYLQFLADVGIVGFLVFCVLMGAFSRMALKLARQPDPFLRILGIGMGGALATTLIHGVVDYLFNANPQFGALFWLVLALGLAGAKLEKSGLGGEILPSAAQQSALLGG
jgi:putative inorganic carbon (hco3(-)) transporter